MAVNTSGWSGGTGEVTIDSVAAVCMGIDGERVVVGIMWVGAGGKRGKNAKINYRKQIAYHMTTCSIVRRVATAWPLSDMKKMYDRFSLFTSSS